MKYKNQVCSETSNKRRWDWLRKRSPQRCAVPRLTKPRYPWIRYRYQYDRSLRFFALKRYRQCNSNVPVHGNVLTCQCHCQFQFRTVWYSSSTGILQIGNVCVQGVCQHASEDDIQNPFISFTCIHSFIYACVHAIMQWIDET